VRALYDRLGLWTIGWGCPTGPATCPTKEAEKSLDFNACPTRPTSLTGQTGWDGEHEQKLFSSRGALTIRPLTRRKSEPRYMTALSSHTDLKSGRTGGTGGTTAEKTSIYGCPTETASWGRWDNLDGWRRRLKDCASIATRREIVADWARAAGGSVEGNVVILPVGLPRGLALAELKTQAMIAGLEVVEQTMACVWCPNSAIPGDTLCEHCRWLAGARP
jgi:hypothetical protein